MKKKRLKIQWNWVYRFEISLGINFQVNSRFIEIWIQVGFGTLVITYDHLKVEPEKWDVPYPYGDVK